MKYRAKCTNWVEQLKELVPGFVFVTDPRGDYYAECDCEEVADFIEVINKHWEKKREIKL